ncbi:MAG: aminoacyl-histidine dipeptidase [Lachnospiraceae bacterium]|nr:aminoacyl-histidine dipeptidase [Lachnospiraceae bacterium]
MSELLTDHKNYIVFKFFQEISRIPRGSGNISGIRDYIASIAKEHGLDHVVDACGNVVVVRDASSEDSTGIPVMLQSHMDMVCAKTSDSNHDFENDPLDLYTEDGFLKARGTTLGGDDGIGVAYMLALLTDPDYVGPRIDCIFTVDEETGMVGANALDLTRIRAKRLINLDSENEGVFTTGCAGGIKVHADLPYASAKFTGFRTDIKISGLLGGHSGDEIVKGRANAILLLSRFLYFLKDSGTDYHLISINGGEKDNAIPREAAASIVVSSSPTKVSDLAVQFKKIVLHEYAATDPGISIEVFEAPRDAEHMGMNESALRSLFLMTYSVPNGVVAMSRDIDGLPETSTNLGIISTESGSIKCAFLLRSSIASRKKELLERMTIILEAAGASVETGGSYPEWAYKKKSPLRDSMAKLWKEMFGRDPVITAIHGGLECGIISSKCPDMDIVSIGPDIPDIHTPNERLDIESASRVYDFLVKYLQDCK